MLVLLDNGQDLNTCANELGCEVGQLLTPLTRYRLRNPNKPWAIDNGAYTKFNIAAYQSLLAREQHRQQDCLFVVLPDVVGSARRTLEIFHHWKSELTGWKLALACQDGQHDLPIPWTDIAAVFIGGSTVFKCSEYAVHIIQAAHALGKWTHVGRVNDPDRFVQFEKLGVNSIDGTGLSRYTHMRRAIANRRQLETLT